MSQRSQNSDLKFLNWEVNIYENTCVPALANEAIHRPSFTTVNFTLKSHLKNGCEFEAPTEDLANPFTIVVEEDTKVSPQVLIQASIETIPWKTPLMTMILIREVGHRWLASWIPKRQSWPDNLVWLMNCSVRFMRALAMG